MKTRYFISKSSRNADIPYDGPSCKKAGIKGGLYYTTYQQALNDAQKLTQANAVAFIVMSEKVTV